MEAIFWVVLEIVGEMFMYLFAEVLFHVGLRGLAAPFNRERDPRLVALGYVLFGALAGGLSLLVFPSLFIGSGWGRIVNVVVTPFVAGACMAALAAWRQPPAQRLFPFDRFAYGYLFALVMALVRLYFGG